MSSTDIQRNSFFVINPDFIIYCFSLLKSIRSLQESIEKVRQDSHAIILILYHGVQPHRPKDDKWKVKENALREAWTRLADLRGCDRVISLEKIHSFLKAVNPHTC